VRLAAPEALPELGVHRLGEATFWRYSYLIAQGGLSLTLYISLAQVLPRSAFPACATALGTVVIAQSVGDFGLAQAAVAILPNPGSLKRRFDQRVLEAGVALAFLLAGAVSVLLCLLAAALVPGPAATPVIAVAPTGAAALVLAGVDGIFRSRGEFRRQVGYVAASNLGAFAGLISAGLWGSATAACIGISAGAVICALPAAVILVRHARAGGAHTSVAAVAGASVPLALSNIAVISSARLNTIILGATASLRSAAVFESAWRLFQLGQYAIGGAATAAAPFISHALHQGLRAQLRRALRRASVLIATTGFVFAAGLVLVLIPLNHVLFGNLGHSIWRSMLWLAPALPLNLVALLITIMLAAASGTDRTWVAIAYLAGAGCNLALLFATRHAHPGTAGAIGAAAGLLVTAVVLALRLRVLLRSRTLRPNDPAEQPAPVTHPGS